MTPKHLHRVEQLHLADLVLPDWHPEASGDARAVVFDRRNR